MDVIHTAIWVSDIEETRAFYEEALGLSFSHEFELDGATNYYVGGEDGAQLQFKYPVDGTAPVEQGARSLDHLAVSVDDTDAEFDRLVEVTGCPVQSEPRDVPAANARVAFVEDPDGYVVELVGPMA